MGWGRRAGAEARQGAQGAARAGRFVVDPSPLNPQLALGTK